MLQKALWAFSQSDWLKATVAALAGLFTGLIAEPIKNLIAFKIKTKRAYGALHRELWAHDWLVSSIAKHPDNDLAMQMTERLLFDVFDHYWATDPEMFFAESRLHQLRMLILALKNYRSAIRDSEMTPEDGIRYMEEELTMCKRTGVLNEHILKKFKNEDHTMTWRKMGAGVAERKRKEERPT